MSPVAMARSDCSFANVRPLPAGDDLEIGGSLARRRLGARRRHQGDGDARPLARQGMPRSLARGRIGGEPAGPLFVHPGEICGVGQEEGRAHGVVQRTTRRVQDRRNITQTLCGLFLDGTPDDGSGARVKRSLPGHEDQAAGLHGLAIGPRPCGALSVWIIIFAMCNLPWVQLSSYTIDLRCLTAGGVAPYNAGSVAHPAGPRRWRSRTGGPPGAGRAGRPSRRRSL